MSKGWREGVTLEAMPYDWRKDVKDTASQLADRVDTLRLKAGSSKASLVTHSLGGLVAQTYVVLLGGHTKVDHFIAIGTPFLGAPLALKAMVVGDDVGITFRMNQSHVEQVVDTFPAVYQVLPSFHWFDGDKRYVEMLSGTGSAMLDYQDTQTLLDSFPYNRSTDSYDGWNHASNFGTRLHEKIDLKEAPGVHRLAIVGTGQLTVRFIQHSTDWTTKKTVWRWKYGNGDGIVPLESAQSPGPGSQVVYVNSDSEAWDHGELPGARPVENYVAGVLIGSPPPVDDPTTGIWSSPNKLFRGAAYWLACPVEVHIYDGAGRHTGPVEDGEIEYGIPGVHYNIMGDRKHWALPHGQEFRVEMAGTDTGTMTLTVEGFDDQGFTDIAVFHELPVTPNMRATMEVGPSAVSHEIIMREEGQPGEEIIGPDAITTGAENLAPAPPPVVSATLYGTVGEAGWFTSDVLVTLTAQDMGHGVLGIGYMIGGVYYSYTGPILITAEGTTILNAGAIDNLGQEQYDPTMVTLRVDQTPPAASAEVNGTQDADGSYSGDVSIHITATDATSGVQDIRYDLDGGTPITVAGNSTTVDVSTPGTHTVRYLATDAAGHSSPEQLVTFSIADPMPAAPTDLAVTNVTETGARVTWTAVPNAVGYRIRLNGNLQAELTGTSYDLTGLAKATTYTVSVTSLSQSGQESSASSLTFTTKALPAPTGLTVYNITRSSATVAWDKLTGAKTYRVWLDGRLVTETARTTVDLTALKSGTSHTVTVGGVDRDGREGAIASRSFKTTDDEPICLDAEPCPPWPPEAFHGDHLATEIPSASLSLRATGTELRRIA